MIWQGPSTAEWLERISAGADALRGASMSWTQAMCDRCWSLWRPNQTPTRLLKPVKEICCACGEETTSGIYIRADPRLVPHPRGKEPSP